MIDFLTRLCQTTRDEVSLLLMPNWLKYTTVGPSQADRTICKESDAGDQICCSTISSPNAVTN